NAAYIGAIAVGSMIFNVIYWLFGFLRMGTSGMTSQAYGARNLEEVTKLLLRSQLIGLLIALAIILLQYPIAQGALFLMRPTPEISQMAQRYFNVCIWGAPAMLGLYGFMGWFIGMQNTRIPMFISIMQNVVNICVSLALVLFANMNIEGVAIGTLVAQWSGMLAAVGFFMAHYRPKLLLHFNMKGVITQSAMTSFFKVNRDIFLRTLFLVAVNFFFTSAGSAQGTMILAVNTLLLQLHTIFSYFMDGFAYAGEAVGGKFYGAKNKFAFNDTIRRLFVWGGAMVLAFTLLYALGGRGFLALLTNDQQVIGSALPYFGWTIALPLAGMAAFVWDGVFIGITATRGMLTSSSLAALLFFATFYLLRPFLGNHALWLAFILYLASRGLIQTYLFKRIEGVKSLQQM
ncbi:MAG: MATE family efflux transporter, partial [Hoylesella shahii]|uniref:MATE family efflux transporter n=1 Tax=Hoylesella shahii TaxID=228603 RepID=UPI003F9FEC92